MNSQIFKNALTYNLPDMERVEVHNVVYRNIDDTTLTMDIYYPPVMEADERLAVVIFVVGYTDSAAQRIVGSHLKDWGPFTSWCRLTAAAELIAITHQTQQPDDIELLLEYIRENGASLNIDTDRIGIWSCSANSPTAISFAMQEDLKYLKFAVFYYSLMLTPDNQLREEINNLCAPRGCYAAELKDVKQLRKDLPLLIVRAGHDDVPYVNESIDHLVSLATEGDVPLTLVDYKEGIHGFDVKAFWPKAPHAKSGEIVRQTLEFMRSNLAIE
jgi:hypothetical protein